MRNASSIQLVLAAVAVVVLTACGSGGKPRPIAYDHESCAYCHMAITDRRLGAQFVSSKRKVHSFDSIECLASYVVAHQADAGKAWVTDFTHPGALIPAEAARFVRAGESLGWTEVLAGADRDGQSTHGAIHAIDGVDHASR